ncbi:hypothetical protein OAF63_06600, partial [Saprospiraceae bacterium]|nr:hypothetical protein [Saprospiraceae bacterium]
YLIYGISTVFTIVYVGKILHQNGRHYILRIFIDTEFGDYINNALLTAYYLFNIGYVFVTLHSWETILNQVELIEMIGQKTGIILLMLGGLHFINILALQIIAQFKNRKTRPKKPHKPLKFN